MLAEPAQGRCVLSTRRAQDLSARRAWGSLGEAVCGERGAGADEQRVFPILLERVSSQAPQPASGTQHSALVGGRQLPGPPGLEWPGVPHEAPEARGRCGRPVGVLLAQRGMRGWAAGVDASALLPFLCFLRI